MLSVRGNSRIQTSDPGADARLMFPTHNLFMLTFWNGGLTLRLGAADFFFGSTDSEALAKGNTHA